MNAAQATRLARLLAEAVHPSMCPITARLYSAEEYEGFGSASAHVVGHEPASSHGPQMLHVVLHVPSSPRDRGLYLDAHGDAWAWSSVQIPPLDCPCECADEPPFGGPENCPRHGRGVRDLDCFRRATAIGWELVDDQAVREFMRRLGHTTPTAPKWAYVIREGDPIRDVLAEYRQHRAKAAA